MFSSVHPHNETYFPKHSATPMPGATYIGYAEGPPEAISTSATPAEQLKGLVTRTISKVAGAVALVHSGVRTETTTPPPVTTSIPTPEGNC
jgi:hypothetical protein